MNYVGNFKYCKKNKLIHFNVDVRILVYLMVSIFKYDLKIFDYTLSF